MNVSALTAYVDRKNAFAKLFGNRQLSIQNAADRQRLAEMLESDLSPENLTCDGEVRGAQLKSKYNSLMTAAKQLQQLDSSVVFG